MKIQINTDRNITGHETFTSSISKRMEVALHRFSDRISRLELHLSDENGHRNGQNDKQCMMEARIEGRHPIAVTHLAETLDQAIYGAADKMVRLIDKTLDRTLDRQRHGSDPLRVPRSTRDEE